MGLSQRSNNFSASNSVGFEMYFFVWVSPNRQENSREVVCWSAEGPEGGRVRDREGVGVLDWGRD